MKTKDEDEYEKAWAEGEAAKAAPQAIPQAAAQPPAEATTTRGMSREQFIEHYGLGPDGTFLANDKGGNAASEVGGQSVAEYYDKWLDPNAPKTKTQWNAGNGENEEVSAAWTSDGKYRDAHPDFDAWDNVNPHPESQLGNGWDEAWKQIGRPVATAAAMYFGGNLIGGAMGAGEAAAAGTTLAEGSGLTAAEWAAANAADAAALGEIGGTAAASAAPLASAAEAASTLAPAATAAGDYTLGSSLGTVAPKAAADYTLGSALGAGSPLVSSAAPGLAATGTADYALGSSLASGLNVGGTGMTATAAGTGSVLRGVSGLNVSDLLKKLPSGEQKKSATGPAKQNRGNPVLQALINKYNGNDYAGSDGMTMKQVGDNVELYDQQGRLISSMPADNPELEDTLRSALT